MWGRRTLWAVSFTACVTVIALAIFSDEGVDDVTTWITALVALSLIFSLPKLRY